MALRPSPEQAPQIQTARQRVRESLKKQRWDGYRYPTSRAETCVCTGWCSNHQTRAVSAADLLSAFPVRQPLLLLSSEGTWFFDEKQVIQKQEGTMESFSCANTVLGKSFFPLKDTNNKSTSATSDLVKGLKGTHSCGCSCCLTTEWKRSSFLKIIMLFSLPQSWHTKPTPLQNITQPGTLWTENKTKKRKKGAFWLEKFKRRIDGAISNKRQYCCCSSSNRNKSGLWVLVKCHKKRQGEILVGKQDSFSAVYGQPVGMKM